MSQPYAPAIAHVKAFDQSRQLVKGVLGQVLWVVLCVDLDVNLRTRAYTYVSYHPDIQSWAHL